MTKQITSSRAALVSRLAQKQADLDAAVSVLDGLQGELAVLRENASPYTQTFGGDDATHPNAATVRRATVAGECVDRLRDEVSQLTDELAKITAREQAPHDLADAEAEIKKLAQAQKATRNALHESEALAAKLDADIAEIETQAQAATDAATAAMLDSGGQYAIPEALKDLDTRLRITRAARQAVATKIEGFQATLEALPQQITDARRAWVACKEKLACFELEKAIQPLLPLMALAANVQYREGGINRTLNQFAVQIPPSLMRKAEDEIEQRIASLKAEGEAAQ